MMNFDEYLAAQLPGPVPSVKGSCLRGIEADVSGHTLELSLECANGQCIVMRFFDVKDCVANRIRNRSVVSSVVFLDSARDLADRDLRILGQTSNPGRLEQYRDRMLKHETNQLVKYLKVEFARGGRAIVIFMGDFTIRRDARTQTPRTLIKTPVFGSLHDGHVLAVRFESDGRKVVISCREISGRFVSICFSDVIDFSGNNIRDGNIILEVAVVGTLFDLSDMGVADAVRARGSGADIDESSFGDGSGIPNVKYFRLSSSYGCDLAIVFAGEMTVEEP